MSNHDPLNEMRNFIEKAVSLTENQDDESVDWSEYQVVKPDSRLYYSWVVGGLRGPIAILGETLKDMEEKLREKGYDDVFDFSEWKRLKELHTQMERTLEGKQ